MSRCGGAAAAVVAAVGVGGGTTYSNCPNGGRVEFECWGLLLLMLLPLSIVLFFSIFFTLWYNEWIYQNTVTTRVYL